MSEIICSATQSPITNDSNRGTQAKTGHSTVFECACGTHEMSPELVSYLTKDDNVSPVTCPHVHWAKAEGVGRDRTQNKTRTPGDFLWILNRRGQPDSAASGDKQKHGLNHSTSGHRDHRLDPGIQGRGAMSGWLSILNTVFSPLCGVRLSYAGIGLITRVHLARDL